MDQSDELKKQYFDSPILADVIICAGEHKTYAHKMILVLASPYFRRAFTSEFCTNQSPEMELQDDNPEAVVAMLKYIYGYSFDEIFDDTDVNFHLQVFAVAGKYEVSGLYDHAVYLVTRDLYRARFSPALYEIVRSIWQDAPEHGGELRHRVMQFCRSNVKSMLPDERFRKLLLEAPELQLAIMDWVCGGEDETDEECSVDFDDWYDLEDADRLRLKEIFLHGKAPVFEQVRWPHGKPGSGQEHTE